MPKRGESSSGITSSSREQQEQQQQQQQHFPFQVHLATNNTSTINNPTRRRRRSRRDVVWVIFLGSVMFGLCYSTIQMWKLIADADDDEQKEQQRHLTDHHKSILDVSSSSSIRSNPPKIPPSSTSSTNNNNTKRSFADTSPVFHPPHTFAEHYPRSAWSQQQQQQQQQQSLEQNSNSTTFNNNNSNTTIIIDPQDPMLQEGRGWDASPIVLEKFQLLLFTTPKVGTTVLKQLCRRMMGYENWPLDEQHQEGNIPHNPQFNQLRYLYHYSYEHAVEMLTSPNWTRALFVRDPLERVLSAYLDKAVRHNGTYVKRHCCGIKKKEKALSLVDQQQMHQHKQLHMMKLQQQQQQLTFMQHQHQHQHQNQGGGGGGGGGDTTGRGGKEPGQEHRRRLQQKQEKQRQDIQNNNNIMRNKNSRIMNKFHSEASLQASMMRLVDEQQTKHPQAVPLGKALPPICANWTLETPTIISWESFVYDILLTSCTADPHWKSQVLPSSNLKFINFVGHFDRLQADTQRLLQKVGAWEEYGSKGWPPGGAGMIFQENTARHKTLSRERMMMMTTTTSHDDGSTSSNNSYSYSYYSNATLRQRVLQLYEQDYANSKLNLTRPVFL